MKLSPLLSAALVAAAAAFAPLSRASATNPCGTLANTGTMVNAFTKYFVEDRYATMRRTTVQQLDSATLQPAVVSDSTVCQTVLDTALNEFRTKDPTWSTYEARGFDNAVFQYGPYYAILIVTNPDPATGERSHYAPLMVFRASDMQVVAVWLV
jgi:hypothetical protein